MYMHFSGSGFQTSIPLDRFMVYGPDYIDIKTALKQAIFSGNFQPVEAACVKVKAQDKRDKLLCVALHREVTVHLVENQTQAMAQDKQQNMINFLNNATFLNRKDVAQVLVSRNHAVLRAVSGGRPGMIREVLVHFLLLLRCTDAQANKWLQPFILLATNPAAMHGRFLPTMPQDDFDVIYRAAESARQAGREGNVTVFHCPNGHPYTIRDCGRPVVTAKCHCGATIGGVSHRAPPETHPF